MNLPQLAKFIKDRRERKMAAGTQQTASLGENNNGDNGQQQTSANGDANANGTNANGSSSEGGAVSDGSGNDGNANGSGSGASGSDSGNYGFDGEFNPERARTLIDTLREENKTLASTNKQLKTDLDEIKALLKGAGKEVPNQGDGGSGSTDTKTDNEALEEIRRFREELAEEKLAAKFQTLATGMGMRPEAVDMAFNSVRSQLNVVNGTPTNLTEVLGILKQAQGFMFAPATGGQQQGGSTNANTGSQGNGPMPTTDEAAAMKAFGIKDVATYRALATGQRPPAAT